MSATPRLGPKLRALRQRERYSQAKLAERLGISASYLNLIEHDRRPLNAQLLIKVAQLFDVDLQSFAGETDARVQSELMESFADPLFEACAPAPEEVQELTAACPGVARAMLRLYRAYRAANESTQSMAAQLEEDMVLKRSTNHQPPSEQVNDFIQSKLNYFEELEAEAERLWDAAQLRADDLYHGLRRHLDQACGIQIQFVPAERDEGAMRRYHAKRKMLVLSEALHRSSRKFQMAHQIGLIACSDVLDELADDELLPSAESRALARVALANYFAGAVLMPYDTFLQAARDSRYDVDRLCNRFGVSFEQACHRLTSLRRPNQPGIPFHFVRADIAGNISKRFSGSGIQIARYGGACPRWNLHSAFLTPGRIQVQVSQMPDGRKYFCIARTLVRSARGHNTPEAIYAITLGCELRYAPEMVYADGVNLESDDVAVPVGPTCRLCDRMDCEQRAFPPLAAPLEIDENTRGISFYAPVPKR